MRHKKSGIFRGLLKASFAIGILIQASFLLVSFQQVTPDQNGAALNLEGAPPPVSSTTSKNQAIRPVSTVQRPANAVAETTTSNSPYEHYRFPPPHIEAELAPPNSYKFTWNHLARHPEAANQSFAVTVNTTQSTIPAKLHYSQVPYCLRGPFYGLANNRVLSLARMLHRGVTNMRPIGLSKKISDWYRLFFDPNPMFWLDYYEDQTTPCFKTNRPEQAYRLNEEANCIPELTTQLLPKLEVRQMAEGILQKDLHPKSRQHQKFVAIHRRNFEGACMRRSGRHHVAKDYCPRDEGRKHCLLEYETVKNYYANLTIDADIWLFTDGQEPTLDATFPQIFNATRDHHVDETTAIFLDMWLMALADEHWAHTESTVDVVVWHWRKYQQTHPQNCFLPSPTCKREVTKP